MTSGAISAGPGRPWPMGATLTDDGVNFAVFSAHATALELCLYAADDPVDIRSIGPKHTATTRYTGVGLVNRVVRAMREYF